MYQRLAFALGLMVLASAGAAAGAPASSRPDDRVALCHGPGDGARHTIVVPASATSAHLAHGDVLGACEDRCSPGACDDGDLCTADSCGADGACTHVATACDDGNPCTADACDPSGGCVYSPIEGSFACDDGNACTSQDACASGACMGSAIPGCCGSDAGCDDGNACTVDTCISGVCSNSPLTCSSGDPCLVAFCDPASGSCSTAPRSCDDAVACTTDSCDPGLGCVHDPSACSVCGDGVRSGAEDCDGADLGGVDCTDFHDTPNTYFQGWYGLTCTRDCYWDPSLCAACGNRLADNTSEQCDTDDLAGQTCRTLGFSDGTLTCHDSCTFDTSACTR